MCTFRSSCCSAHLSWAHTPVINLAVCLGPEKRGGGTKGGDRLHWQVQGSMFEVLWNLECPLGLSQREICAHFNEGNLAQFGQ